MKTQPVLYPFYCHTCNGSVKVESIRSSDFPKLENNKIVNAPNCDIARMTYLADLKNGVLKSNVEDR